MSKLGKIESVVSALQAVITLNDAHKHRTNEFGN